MNAKLIKQQLHQAELLLLQLKQQLLSKQTEVKELKFQLSQLPKELKETEFKRPVGRPKMNPEDWSPLHKANVERANKPKPKRITDFDKYMDQIKPLLIKFNAEMTVYCGQHTHEEQREFFSKSQMYQLFFTRRSEVFAKLRYCDDGYVFNLFLAYLREVETEMARVFSHYSLECPVGWWSRRTQFLVDTSEEVMQSCLEGFEKDVEIVESKIIHFKDFVEADDVGEAVKYVTVDGERMTEHEAAVYRSIMAG